MDEWWSANRPAAPRLFLAELDAALRLIATAPFAGRRAEGVRKKDTRVLVLRRTRYLVFYRVVDERLVRLLAVRHGSREHDSTI
ncbi:MAG: type II toxin-antitoxin system RelE/ParE family toxin [Deltaproteobacteria bacterium]|nr:type II toxin-antitoxin system RelE/ParE family toxin [Deltaproteobacteria bacterium]